MARSPPVGADLADLVVEARRNEALADALTTHVGDPRRLEGGNVLDRAARRGDIPVEIDRELAWKASPKRWYGS